MSRNLVAFALTAATICANAQTWPLEPEKVVGIRLGVPLSESGYPECSGTPSNEPCLERRGPSLSRLHRTGLQATVNVFEYEGVVGGITMTMPHTQFEEFVRTMIERYGGPQEDKLSQVQNRLGAIFSNRQLRWSGVKISITMNERYSDLDTSVVHFFDKSVAASLARKNRERAKSEVSKL